MAKSFFNGYYLPTGRTTDQALEHDLEDLCSDLNDDNSLVFEYKELHGKTSDLHTNDKQNVDTSKFRCMLDDTSDIQSLVVLESLDVEYLGKVEDFDLSELNIKHEIITNTVADTCIDIYVNHPSFYAKDTICEKATDRLLDIDDTLYKQKGDDYTHDSQVVPSCALQDFEVEDEINRSVNSCVFQDPLVPVWSIEE